MEHGPYTLNQLDTMYDLMVLIDAIETFGNKHHKTIEDVIDFLVKIKNDRPGAATPKAVGKIN